MSSQAAGKTPGFNTRLQIAFTADKNGKAIAYYWSRAVYPRWIRIGYDRAKLLVAGGDADQVAYTKI